MNEQQIMGKIRENLDQKLGEKAGGSGHLSQVSISDIKIEDITKVTQHNKTHLKVQYSYTVDILSEFSYAEEHDPDKEPDPYDPYHYRKTDEIIINL